MNKQQLVQKILPSHNQTQVAGKSPIKNEEIPATIHLGHREKSQPSASGTSRGSIKSLKKSVDISEKPSW
jgi:hypothetical protein